MTMTTRIEPECDQPEALLARAMTEAHGIVARLRDAEPDLEPGLRGVARTVAGLIEERRLLDPKLDGPLGTLLDGLDRMIAAGARRVSRAVLRGSGPDGDVYDEQSVIERDARAEALAPIRDALRRSRERVERVRDSVAADQAVRALYDRTNRR